MSTTVCNLVLFVVEEVADCEELPVKVTANALPSPQISLELPAHGIEHPTGADHGRASEQ